MSIYKQFVVREMRSTDRDFISRTVLFGYFQACSYAGSINRDSFMQGHNKIINSLMNYAKVLVVADVQDPDLIIGFIIYEQSLGEFDVIHYAYVRKEFRGLGLLKNLKEIIKTKDNLAISHKSDDIKPARLKKYYNKTIFDPYLQTKE